MTFFRALQVTEQSDGAFTRAVTERRLEDLPPNDTLIRVRFSSLNYKDALSASGNKGVTRAYPHTPGIDAAGEIVETTSPSFKAGDHVIVTSYDLGMNTAGGFAEYIRVPAAWVVPMPAGLNARDAMTIGTAGFTAALCVHQLQRHDIAPAMGEVLVTGATGGVGCMAVALLARLGYTVVAATGKAGAQDWLRQLGATHVLSREDVDDASTRPLLRERWAGVIDTVGGNILATAIKSAQRNGCVTACGLTQSHELKTTVYPFILRGVALQGVDSVETPIPMRQHLWQNLAGDWRLGEAAFNAIRTESDLSSLNPYIDDILHGRIRGRVLVKM
jgi:putative YhdH/YhfP family quinone oxidoreductase